MRADVGAICGLGREGRFFTEAAFAVGRLGGTVFVVAVVVLVLVVVVLVAVVPPGVVFAAGIAAGPELDGLVCAVASTGAIKSNVPQENSAAEM